VTFLSYFFNCFAKFLVQIAQKSYETGKYSFIYRGFLCVS
jgi:hypothetical protein